ncbi:putative N6-adenine-specific DNA methylase [Rubidibacter lacunae KORDI 51-2]|uniref:Putative N6-adenine-specific DNA methylase n=1 Tax=Rubidibacter lacunae KORDI 51-2 TaxID=582515 RepID=U5DF94_9CHRO|nr:putative N6-adenine-specific DNA methylase [Rubidibacter lacunae KORDI 51-2]
MARGLEEIAARELQQLGAALVQPEVAGVAFTGDRATLYKANLWLRTVFRVLVPLAEFPCRSAQDLFRGTYAISWEEYLPPHLTLAVYCTGSNRQLNHTHFSALQVKNAIVDRQRQQFGKRSSIDTQEPDVAVHLHIRGDRGTVSLDSSGSSLHRRGYRPAVGHAPLKETLAAGLLALGDWQPELPLLDPMCGSGTLLLEAGAIACNIAPGLFRQEFGFQRWLDFDAELWDRLVFEARQQQRSELPAPIVGSDLDPEAILQCRDNARRCGLGDRLHFECRDLAEVTAPADRGVMICNPPYGKRLGDEEELCELYKQLGDIFKQRFTGWTAYVLSGSKELSKCIGLRASQRLPVYNGPLRCTLLRYELY